MRGIWKKRIMVLVLAGAFSMSVPVSALAKEASVNATEGIAATDHVDGIAFTDRVEGAAVTYRLDAAEDTADEIVRGEDGKPLNGWRRVKGAYYLYFQGKLFRSIWICHDGKWYYLDETGARCTGWLERKGKWYYLSTAGVRRTGWVKVDGTWYCFDENGVRQTGWRNEDGAWYFLTADGKMVTGWKQIGGKKYFFRPTGKMATGWVYSSGEWYYLNSKGNPYAGWKYYRGHWYYFNTEGRMLTDTWIEDDYVDAEGVWQKNAVRQPSGYAKLDVNCIYQKPELPNGCEVTSLAIVLKYLGFDVTKETLADQYLPKGRIGSTSPYVAYIGNPRVRSASWYCYSPVIARCGNSYLQTQTTDYEAVDLTGQEFDRILCEVDAGRPVILWGTLSMSGPSTGSDWVIDGVHYTKYMNLHCLVLIGYDQKQGLAYMADPLRGNVTYSLSTVKRRYEQLGKQAVVIKKR